MNIEYVQKLLEIGPKFIKLMDMEFISTPDENECVATMPVDDRNIQPFGVLSGGATLALAETLAGVGSLSICRECMCAGMNVSGSHIRAVANGDTITATARLVHKGKQTHVWQVNVTNGEGVLVSTISVTNFIMKKTSL